MEFPIRYVDIEKTKQIFQTLNLNEDNILDFMKNPKYDTGEYYLLKCYLLATLENYKHIHELTKYYNIDKNIPTEEIINKKESKTFWDLVSKENDTILDYNPFYELIDLLSESYILYCDINYILSDSAINYENYKDIIDRKKEKYEELVRKINDKYAKVLKKKNLSIVALYVFMISLNTFDKETLKESLDVFLNKDVYTAKLKLDLNFNYNIICFLFDINTMQEENIAYLLNKIREQMQEEDITLLNMTPSDKDEVHSCPPKEKVISKEYRTIDFQEWIKSDEFFNKTSNSSTIKDDMDELMKKYEMIKNIESNQEYVLACYKFTMDMLQIHPYYNGNGRTARYLFYALLLKRNILPPTVTDSYDYGKCYYTRKSKEDFDRYIAMRSHITDRRMK